jgi:hypothetical protein
MSQRHVNGVFGRRKRWVQEAAVELPDEGSALGLMRA